MHPVQDLVCLLAGNNPGLVGLSGMFQQLIRPSVMTWVPGPTIRPTKPCSVLDDLSKIRSR